MKAVPVPSQGCCPHLESDFPGRGRRTEAPQADCSSTLGWVIVFSPGDWGPTHGGLSPIDLDMMGIERERGRHFGHRSGRGIAHGVLDLKFNSGGLLLAAGD